jgi:hypothetical protein
MSGHRTRSALDRYNVVSDGDLRDASPRLGHTGGHTSPSLAFGGGEKSQILRKSKHGEVAEWPKAAVC